MILFTGWSWIVDQKTLNQCLCLGIHPSDLSCYRGGSPIQHQIIDGIKCTKVTLMSLSSDKIDAGDIYAQEPLSLEGSTIDEIFADIIMNSKIMLRKFITNFSAKAPYIRIYREVVITKENSPTKQVNP